MHEPFAHSYIPSLSKTKNNSVWNPDVWVTLTRFPGTSQSQIAPTVSGALCQGQRFQVPCANISTLHAFSTFYIVFYSAPEATICCILVSYPPPACFLGPDLRVIIVSISHSVHIDAAGLQVDLLLSELQNS